MNSEEFTKLCIDLEHFETDPWAAPSVLEKELLTERVIDPCVGTGILTVAARDAGYSVVPFDIHHWGFPGTILQDFTKLEEKFHGIIKGATVFMNPPFSIAELMVQKSFEYGSRKVLCFQRFAWYESADRKEFWDTFTPAKVYVCGNRATCWRHDIPKDEQGYRIDPKTGKRLGSTSIAHAWFSFESGHCGGTLMDRIYKTVKTDTKNKFLESVKKIA